MTPSKALEAPSKKGKKENWYIVETDVADNPPKSGATKIPEDVLLAVYPWLKPLIDNTDFWDIEWTVDLTHVKITLERCDVCGQSTGDCTPETCDGDIKCPGCGENAGECQCDTIPF